MQGTLKEGSYTALDISDECLDSLKSLVPSANTIKGSVTDISEIEQLKDKKFNLIYIRWVLAYTPSAEFTKTLSNIISMLSDKGKLIIEECDVYQVQAIDTETEEHIKHPTVQKWLDLTRIVDDKFNANFSMGSILQGLLQKFIGDRNTMLVSHYHPKLTEPDVKEILSLGLKSAGTVLTSQGLITKADLDTLISEIDHGIVTDPKTSLLYVKNTICEFQRI